MSIRTTLRWLLAAIAVGAAACAAQADGAPSETAVEPGALRVGDSGPEVQRVHAFLSSHGYFPNGELSAAFPSWRPAVSEAPGAPDVFDEHLEQAVYAFQRMYGLPLTGAVDPATHAAMAEPRCGVPDHVSAEGDKWAVHGAYWGKTSFTWSYSHSSAPAGISESTVVAILDAQFATWRSRSSFSFTKVSSNANIPIGWTDLAAPDIGLTSTFFEPRNSVISLARINFDNKGPSWATGTPGSGQMDLQSVALHEIGHALGIGHSSVTLPNRPVMSPSIAQRQMRRTLQVDDVQALHALRNALVHRIVNPPAGEQGATSVVAGTDGSVWITGTTQIGTGYRMYKSDGNFGWQEHRFGGLATELVVLPLGQIWHINDLGEIYAEGATGWVRIDGAASHIAASGFEVWHLSKAVTRGRKDHDLYRWNGSGWDRVPGNASDIAGIVDLETNEPQFFYTNEAGQVWTQLISGSELGSVFRRPNVPGGACRIKGGALGTVLAQACPESSFGMNTYVWNFQVGKTSSTGEVIVPDRSSFTPISLKALDVTMDSGGRIWSLAGNGFGGPPVIFETF